MQIFTLPLVLKVLDGCFAGKATASLAVSCGVTAPAVKASAGQAASATAGSPGGSPPWLLLSHLHTRCGDLQKAGQRPSGFFFFPLLSLQKNYIFREKNPRLLNLRRAISITLYIITSNLLTADYKVFFNHMLQRKRVTFPPKNTPSCALTPAIHWAHSRLYLCR